MWAAIILIGSVVVFVVVPVISKIAFEIDLRREWRRKRLNRMGIARELDADWPVLNAWAAAHGWRVSYLEIAPWLDRLSIFTGNPVPGPYLMVSGEVDGVAVDVVRVPYRAPYDWDHRLVGYSDEFHLVVVPDSRDSATIYLRHLTIRLGCGLLVARVWGWQFPLKPNTIPATVRMVLAKSRRASGA